ncbi:MAG: divalent-cation tolerance protein CutA [Pseudomonadota bacterium]|jgi:periplasmic divalent cation tolerance protein|nr:divalent-cation tolerance protein CutA [Pseudomonadota bacterium]
MTDSIVVLTSCPDEAAATRIAGALLEAGLVACVTRQAVRSMYRWEGRLVDEPEVLLVIKTLASRFTDVEMRLKSLHPYTVPEIIALPISAGSAAYLSWLAAEVTP